MFWLCLDFPRLPIELFLQAGTPPDPLVVSSGGNRPSVVACDARAQAAGIRPGMWLSAAYALAPQIDTRVRDPAREHAALEAAALWALQFTSHVSIVSPGSLLLEIGGSFRLFGGLERLRDCVRDAAAELGHDVTLAATPTPLGAQWLACAGFDMLVHDRGTLRDHLGRLPIEALELRPDAAASLDRLGVRTLGELLALPRDGLARRFGQTLLDLLDRALGRLPDPRPPLIPPERFRVGLALPSPVAEVEALLFAAHRLVLQLCGFLSGRNAGVTRLRLALIDENRRTTEVNISLSIPSRDPKHLIALLRERLTLTLLPARIESIVLEAPEVAQLAPRNFSFFPDHEQSREEKAVLVEKLRARLGEDAVHGLALYPDARPELAWREAEPGAKPGNAPPLPRPAWLLARPRALQSHDGLPCLDGPLALLDGPERIESGWWDDNDAMRDYFVARNPHGATFWVYRERTPQGNWFLHGIFA
ncbi:MAG TPA: DNA polymerase Y family protein [Burkholderiales bacterium]|nr:DNA polymerase Y family protein [Burkholderiales bacterium]